MDDSDGKILSELDDTELILFKTGEHREPHEHQEKNLKLDIESRHYAYDMESMLISTPQLNGTTSDVHEVVLNIARQLYTAMKAYMEMDGSRVVNIPITVSSYNQPLFIGDSHPQPGFIYVKLHEMLARYYDWILTMNIIPSIALTSYSVTQRIQPRL